MFGVCVWFQRHEVDLSKMWWKGLLWIRVVGKGAVGGGGITFPFMLFPYQKYHPHLHFTLKLSWKQKNIGTVQVPVFSTTITEGHLWSGEQSGKRELNPSLFFHTKKVPGTPLRTEALVHGLNFICFVFLMSASPTELLWTPLGQIYRYYWLIPYEESHTFILQGKKVDLQGNLRNGKWKNPKWHAHILNGKKLESTFM